MIHRRLYDNEAGRLCSYAAILLFPSSREHQQLCASSQCLFFSFAGAYLLHQMCLTIKLVHFAQLQCVPPRNFKKKTAGPHISPPTDDVFWLCEKVILLLSWHMGTPCVLDQAYFLNIFILIAISRTIEK
jgi:hypothetical protein